MTKLSRQQLDYANNRLSSIRHDEWKKIVEGYFLPEKEPPLLLKVIADIKKGKLKPKDFYNKPDMSLSRSHTIHEVFGIEISRYKQRDVKAYDAATKAHNERWKKIMDEFFLGDAAAVLAQIRDLEAGKA